MKNRLTIVALLFVCLPPASMAQALPPTLTLSEALARGLARSDLQLILTGRSSQAESEVLAKRTWDNPELLISSENTHQDGVDNGEKYLTFSQRIESFGVRKLRISAAEHQLKGALYQNQSQQWDIKALVQQRFFDALYYQERVEVIEQWETETAALTAIIALREQAGEVSGYDRRRLERELSQARLLLGRERSAHAANWEQLRALLELDGDYRLAGSLLGSSDVESTALSVIPELLAYDEAIQAAALDEKAAGRWAMAEITLEAGVKQVSMAGHTDQGFFLAARLPIPAFNRKKSQVMQARARGMVARGEKAMALSRVEGRTRALRLQIQQLRAALDQFQKTALVTSQELVDIAAAAYQAGEMEILALLDGHQSLRDARLEALSMAADTRALMIELERLGGGQ